MPREINILQQDISKLYLDNPFHNWPHGKYVGNTMMRLEDDASHWISPGRMAGYFHDADHQGFVQEDDEERAAKIAHDYLVKKGFDRGYIDKVRMYIMGTIFKERGNLPIPEQKKIADADLSKMGGDYREFIRNAVRYFLETQEKGTITDEQIIDFFKNNQPGFYSHLTEISGKDETPFLTPLAQTLFPHFAKNKDSLARDVEENPGKLIKVVRDIEVNPKVAKWREISGD